MKDLWNIADLIDLHFFLHIDEELCRQQGEQVLAKRDRVMYLAKIAPLIGKSETIAPRLLVRKWLNIRRLQFMQERGRDGQVLPGKVWQEMTVITRWIFFITGLLGGIGLAGSFLIYAGKAPLNVATYFGLFVGVQLLLIALQALFFLYRTARRMPMGTSVLYTLIGRMLVKGADWLRRRLYKKITGQQRLDLAALLGSVQQRKELAPLFFWPAFVLVQLGSTGFNLGVLGATLGKVVFSDIAFAWQSSLQISADAVSRLSQWLALPWSWIVHQAYPSLEQIKGSQVILKEGMAGMVTSDLVSWWPFLCCAVAVYGLLPRLLLLALGLWRKQRALDQLHFEGLGFRPLLQRLTAPRIDTNGTLEHKPQAKGALPAEPIDPAPEAAAVMPESAFGAQALLIPDELFDDCPQDQLASLLAPDGQEITFIRYNVPGSEEEPLARLRTAGTDQPFSSILLLQEAWQPPLKETGQFLRSLRQTVGPSLPIRILLIGKPTSATLLTPVRSDHLQIWTKTLQAMADPFLDLSPLVQP